MTAFFLAPIYIIVNIYIFMRITGWLKTGFPGSRDEKRDCAFGCRIFFFCGFVSDCISDAGRHRAAKYEAARQLLARRAALYDFCDSGRRYRAAGAASHSAYRERKTLQSENAKDCRDVFAQL